jgi:hypothetical protein
MVKLIIVLLLSFFVLLFVVIFDIKDSFIGEDTNDTIKKDSLNKNTTYRKSKFINCQCQTNDEKNKCGYQCYDKIESTITNGG